MIKVIFFDFDGTISDARKIAEDSLIKTLEDFEYDFDKKEALKLLGTKMPIILKKLGLKAKDIEVVRTRFYKYFTRAALGGGINPCVSLEPLWELKKDYPLIVVSNSETSFLRASIRKLKIDGLFKGIYGAEKFNHKDQMLKKLFGEMGIKASEAIYVGDRFSDVKFARKAGCVAVAVHNKCSWSSLAEIKGEKPNYIIKDFRGLRKLVRELNLFD